MILDEEQPELANSFIISEPYLKTDNLFVWSVDYTIFTLPYDAIEQYLILKVEQIIEREQQRFLSYQNRLLPLIRISELLDYNYYLPEQSSWKIDDDSDAPTKIILIIHREDRLVALESSLDRIVATSHLAIEPFDNNFSSPIYCYGCTPWLENLALVIDGAALLENSLGIDWKTKARFFNEGRRQTADGRRFDLMVRSEVKNKAYDALSTTNIFKKPTILVVDDSRTLRKIALITLQREGYQVLEAADGQEAIAQLRQNSNIHLVISDIDMPNMNGFEFLNYCRQDPKLAKLPVIMLSTHDSDRHKQYASQLGASAYFTKPYQESELLAKLKTIIK
ncbi:MAG: response regulator [Xenococcaceae cyanobacterium]